MNITQTTAAPSMVWDASCMKILVATAYKARTADEIGRLIGTSIATTHRCLHELEFAGLLEKMDKTEMEHRCAMKPRYIYISSIRHIIIDPRANAMEIMLTGGRTIRRKLIEEVRS